MEARARGIRRRKRRKTSEGYFQALPRPRASPGLPTAQRDGHLTSKWSFLPGKVPVKDAMEASAARVSGKVTGIGVTEPEVQILTS